MTNAYNQTHTTIVYPPTAVVLTYSLRSIHIFNGDFAMPYPILVPFILKMRIKNKIRCCSTKKIDH